MTRLSSAEYATSLASVPVLRSGTTKGAAFGGIVVKAKGRSELRPAAPESTNRARDLNLGLIPRKSRRPERPAYFADLLPQFVEVSIRLERLVGGLC